MYTRLLKIDIHSNHSVFIFGPRGTGKTHWVKHHFPHAIYLDLLDGEVYSELLSRPERLEAKIPKGNINWIIVDEIQRVPDLLNEVHRLIETYEYKFVLTGSSARSLRRRGVNLLAGRALTNHLHPLTRIELGTDFDIHRSLTYGHLPAAVKSRSPKKYLDSYVKTYLREEVLQEGLTRNIGLFSRFLETASFSVGQSINYSEIARESGTNRKTICNYFDILEDLLIGSRLPVFQKRARREMVQHPKFYLFDVGVFRTIRPMGPLDSPEEAEGPALETLFLQELRAINEYYDLGYHFFYWRTRNQLEVDFIAYGERGLHAFEIKRKSRLTPRDFKGLRFFGQDFPIANLHMIYGGIKPRFEDTIRIHPYKDIFSILKDILEG